MSIEEYIYSRSQLGQRLHPSEMNDHEEYVPPLPPPSGLYSLNYQSLSYFPLI